VALGATFGLAFAVARRARGLVIGLIASLLLAYLPILAEPRFHLPLVPALAAYASSFFGTAGWCEGLTSSLRGREMRAWLAWLTVLLLVALWVQDLASDWPRLAAVFAPGGNQLHLDY
jgi:hypothetical protein